MVLRDRNHPSIVIWGVRINESANDPELYQATTKEAKRYDPSRPTSGSMTRRSTAGWQQDVFAFDDYHAEPDGSVSIAEPVPGVPYMLAEAVGQFNWTARKNFAAKYRRSADLMLQQAQARSARTGVRSRCRLAAPGTELRIDGYPGNRVALSRSFSPDRSRDRFVLAADDVELAGDGADATRLFSRWWTVSA